MAGTGLHFAGPSCQPFEIGLCTQKSRSILLFMHSEHINLIVSAAWDRDPRLTVGGTVVGGQLRQGSSTKIPVRKYCRRKGCRPKFPRI